MIALRFNLANFTLIVFATIFSVNSFAADIFVRKLEGALKKTERAMVGVRANSDIVFMIEQAHLITGRNVLIEVHPEIINRRKDGWIQETEYKMWEIRKIKLPRVGRGVGVTADPVLPVANIVMTPEQKFLAGLVIMQRSIGCSPGFDIYRDVGEPYFEYISAHQLLSMLIARARGCIDEEMFSRNVTKYLQRVYTEMIHHKGPLTDLQVERAAFISLAGRSDLIDKDMVRKILNEQSDSGLWKYDMPVAHTSALAYLLISAVYSDRAGVSSL